MPIPLLEGERGAVPFIVDRSTPFVTESRNGVTFTRIPGRFSICDSVNGNNRRYPKKVWEKNLSDGSTLKEAIKKNAAFGLLEHPADGRISLLSPICILVTDAKLQPGRDGNQPITEVVGELVLLNTAEGQKLKALIEVGYNPLVSSRGFGSVIKGTDGIDEVQDDYVCEGWDVVLRPSFDKAELWVPREGESKQEIQDKSHEKALAESSRGVNLWHVYQHFASKNHNKPFGTLSEAQAETIVAHVASLKHEDIAKIDQEFTPKQEARKVVGHKCSNCGKDAECHLETSGGPVCDDCRTRDSQAKQEPEKPKEDNLKEESAPSQAAAPAAASKPQLTEKSMTINEIKSRIGQVRGLQVPKNPGRFAEGMSEMAQLHQEIANFIAEDGKREWTGKQLHDELSRVEHAWSEAQQAPSKAAIKLTENYSKVLRVTKVLGEAAVNIRKKLSEALSQNAEAAQLIEDLTERGRAWVEVADKRKGRVAELEHKLEVACEALDIIRDRYNEDMTDMGRRVITLEFAEKAQTDPIQKALKEAKLPKDIIAIREQLTEDDKKCTCGKVPCVCKKEEPKKEESKKVTNESQKDVKAPAPKQEEGKKNSASAEPQFERVLVPSVHTVTESVAMVQRLSASRLTENEKRELAQVKA